MKRPTRFSLSEPKQTLQTEILHAHDLDPQRSNKKINRPQEAAAKWEKVACSPLSLCVNICGLNENWKRLL